MPAWRAISRKNHLNAGWSKFLEYHFAAGDVTCPLLAAELPHAVAYFPIGFILRETGQYELTAIQSLQQGLNLYVNLDGQWLTPYVPSYYRSYPFRLLRNDTGEHVLCVDEDSNLFHVVRTDTDVPLFGTSSEYSDEFSEVVKFLQQRHNNQSLTQSLVDQITGLNLIEPWPVNLNFGNENEVKPVQGLYRINEAALQALPPHQLAALTQGGAVAMAYAQLLSQPRLQDFNKRYQSYAQEVSRKSTDEINLDSLFGDQLDTIKFGF